MSHDTLPASNKLPCPGGKCPIDSLLRLLMGPWTTLILWTLHNKGEHRFGELRKTIAGISARVLTERLRMLEEHGIVYRHHVPVIPPQVSYGLTDRGRELRAVLQPLAEIAQRWQQEDRALHERVA
jgi:DNA-binding HxlR family transcriptional regulator